MGDRESTSVFITLAAREYSPELRIHARGETDASIRRLRRAGADYVNSPYHIGGMRAAASILRPSVVDFLDLSLPNSRIEVDLEEIRVGETSAIVGLSVAELETQASQLRVIALKRPERDIELVPEPTTRIAAEDHLVVNGEREDLSRVAQKALPESP